MSNEYNSFLLAFICGWLVFSPTPKIYDDELVVYEQYCSDYKHNKFSCPKNQKLHVSKSQYRVNFDKQTVIAYPYVQALNQCQVYDAKNWRCNDDVNWSMAQDGKYSSGKTGPHYPTIDKEGQPSILPVKLQVSSFVYYINSIWDYLR